MSTTTPPARRRPALPAPAPDAHSLPGEQIIKMTHKHAGQIMHQEEEITHPHFSVNCMHPARVKTGGRVTRNLGGMNFLTVEASVEMPCNPTLPDIQATFDVAAAQVDEHILSRLPPEDTIVHS